MWGDYSANPYMMQRPMMPQPYQQMPQTNMMQQQQPQQQSGPAFVQVPTVQHIEQVQMIPGKSALVMAQNESVFAFRIADQMGVVSTTYYRFEPYNPTAPAAAAGDFVTRQEFQQFVESLTGQQQKEATAE